MKNYYEALEIYVNVPMPQPVVGNCVYVNGAKNSAEVPEKIIKSQYRKLAALWHPDRNNQPGAKERFQQIEEAYRVLSDPASRAEYDATGHAPRPKNDDLLPFLSKLVLQVIDEHAAEIDNVDIVAKMREHLEKQKTAAFESLAEREKLCELREKAMSKLKSKSPENVIAGLIGEDLKRQNMICEATRNAIAMLERGLLMLDDYSFDFTALLKNPNVIRMDFKHYNMYPDIKPEPPTPFG